MRILLVNAVAHLFVQSRLCIVYMSLANQLVSRYIEQELSRTNGLIRLLFNM